MEAFAYSNGELAAEGVSVAGLAEKYGTPLYVYSRNHFRARYRALREAMSEVDPLICYSVKANSNSAVIRTLAEEGAGVDVVSGGELFRSLSAGVPADRTVFAGVGKTAEEIRYALENDILFFTVESEPEAKRISECASKSGTVARIAFRINPDVKTGTHKHVTTGKKGTKFGIDVENAEQAYANARKLPSVEIAGLHMHIGSQILSPDPFRKALEAVTGLCATLKSEIPSFRYLDIGGGMGIDYRKDETPLYPGDFAEAVCPLIKQTGLKPVLEPGRFLTANGGILVCAVQYVKTTPSKTFLVVDTGMNDLIRPALYDAHHEIVPVTETSSAITADVVGPVCETGDFLALDRQVPAVEAGALLSVKGAGAYGFVMASNYNSRPRPAEVMVEDGAARLIRKRETREDLVRGER
ncbi:MAG: diaminopimelate decarboxylase [Kiritimatiellia bacterium]